MKRILIFLLLLCTTCYIKAQTFPNVDSVKKYITDSIVSNRTLKATSLQKAYSGIAKFLPEMKDTGSVSIKAHGKFTFQRSDSTLYVYDTIGVKRWRKAGSGSPAGGAAIWGAITGTLSSQADLMAELLKRPDSTQQLKVDTANKAAGKILKYDPTCNCFRMRNDSIGGGLGAVSILKWRSGDENAPGTGDTLIVNSAFSGKYGEMYRGSNYGYFLESVVNDTGFTRVNDTTFKVKPAFAANEWYYIRLTDSSALTQVTLEAPASHPSTTIAYSSSADGGNNGGSGTSRTWSHTVSSGTDRYLLVGFVGDVSSGADDVSSVTYNGVAMTLIAKQLQGASSGNRWQYVYGLANPASGAHNAVVTFSSSHWILAGSIEYTGVQGIDTYTTATAFTNSKTTSLTTGVNNCWTVLFSNGNAVTQSAGSGSTLRRQAGDSFWAWFDSGGAITPAGSYSMNTTMTPGSGITHIMVSIKPY